MKFWQLKSAFRGFDDCIKEVANSPAWQVPFGEWFTHNDDLVENQDRERLDTELPEAFVFQVAAAVGDRLVFYLNDGWLRAHPVSQDDRRLSALEAVTSFGGGAIENVLEYGSLKVIE